MANQLNSIADRFTPSTPIELTFGAQPLATGRKYTLLFGHRSASGGEGLDYTVYDVTNVADPDAAKIEIEALSGAGSQISKMVIAAINANLIPGRSNFPALRIVMLPNAETAFGSAGEAITAAKQVRCDMIVSCYPAQDSTNRTLILNMVSFVSGVDRDLKGQYGSSAVFGSIEALSAQVVYAINSRGCVVNSLPDTNTALVTDTGDTVSGSPILVNMTSTAGIYPGAVAAGTGIPVGAKVLSVTKTTVTLNVNATASASAETITFQNGISQPAEIIAAATAASMMSFQSPYIPLQGVEIGGLVPPAKHADWIEVDPNGASEQALVAGLSPLMILPGNKVGFIRTRTTYTTLPSLIVATFYIDWQDIVNMFDFREVVYQITQQPPFNNNPGGTKASQEMAKRLKDQVLLAAYQFETQGAFQFVKELSKFFVVSVSTTSRGRFDFRIPVDVTPGLFVIAGNVVGVAFTDNFTL